jgi:magnesium-transporting ATPase (P-type)
MYETGVKYRSMGKQVGLMIVTLGFYSIYWFYQTACELAYLDKDESANPGLWTILLFVPFGAIFSWYFYCGLYERMTMGQMNRWLLFVLYIVFVPAVWFIVQTELNKRATYGMPYQPR